MPTWQSRLFQVFLRLRLKRRVAASEAELVRFARKVMGDESLSKIVTPKDVSVRNITENGINGEWVWWDNQPQNFTVYYLHGGGYVTCSPRQYRPFTAQLARQASARVFALDYRLAPEHRFPAPIEDAVAGYRWLLDQGIQPDNLVIGGDSAGGGLTMATLVSLRDAGLPLPAAAVVISPWTDLAATGQSCLTNHKKDPMFYGDTLKPFAQIYLGGASATDPLASPLYADLTGLPPLRIYAGSTEVLLDDSKRLAEKARQHGVTTELHIAEKQPHVWPIFYPLLPEAGQTIADIAAFYERFVTKKASASQAAAVSSPAFTPAPETLP